MSLEIATAIYLALGLGLGPVADPGGPAEPDGVSAVAATPSSDAPPRALRGPELEPVSPRGSDVSPPPAADGSSPPPGPPDASPDASPDLGADVVAREPDQAEPPAGVSPSSADGEADDEPDAEFGDGADDEPWPDEFGDGADDEPWPDEFGDGTDDEPWPDESGETSDGRDDLLPGYDPLRDSPQAVEARHWVRAGIVTLSTGGVLLVGAVLMAASDPCNLAIGNSCQADARNRAALIMGVPAAIFLGGGAAALAVGIRRRNALSLDLQAGRGRLGITVRGRF